MTSKWVCWLMVVAGCGLFALTASQWVRGLMRWDLAVALLIIQVWFTALNVWLLRRSKRLAEHEARWAKSIERLGR